jgi:hypothetical protein
MFPKLLLAADRSLTAQLVGALVKPAGLRLLFH